MKFEVSATFGEGATVALVDPETSAVLKPHYDAETTIGHLQFVRGEETTIVWTRMWGSNGALMGEAILSDSDVLALTIERAVQGATQRPFILFAAASASAAAAPAPRPRLASLSQGEAGAWQAQSVRSIRTDKRA
ncbi:MAG: hypothetical protein WCF81_01095 [Roseiarcus sp.]